MFLGIVCGWATRKAGRGGARKVVGVVRCCVTAKGGTSFLERPSRGKRCSRCICSMHAKRAHREAARGVLPDRSPYHERLAGAIRIAPRREGHPSSARPADRVVNARAGPLRATSPSASSATRFPIFFAAVRLRGAPHPIRVEIAAAARPWTRARSHAMDVRTCTCNVH